MANVKGRTDILASDRLQIADGEQHGSVLFVLGLDDLPSLPIGGEADVKQNLLHAWQCQEVWIEHGTHKVQQFLNEELVLVIGQTDVVLAGEEPTARGLLD